MGIMGPVTPLSREARKPFQCSIQALSSNPSATKKYMNKNPAFLLAQIFVGVVVGSMSVLIQQSLCVIYCVPIISLDAEVVSVLWRGHSTEGHCGVVAT
jgi:hypothetical protein